MSTLTGFGLVMGFVGTIGLAVTAGFGATTGLVVTTGLLGAASFAVGLDGKATGLAGAAGLTGVAGLAGVAGFAGTAGLAGAAGFETTLTVVDFAQIVTESESVCELTPKLPEVETVQAHALVGAKGNMVSKRITPAKPIHWFLDFQFMPAN